MGLGLAGAISGAGNAMTQGLQTLNSGIVQMGVNQSLSKNDREFQLKKMEMQQQFERAMQTEKIAADRQNTLDTISAKGEQDRITGAQTIAGQKDIHAADAAAADARQEKQLSQQQSLKLTELGITKQIHDEDRAALNDRYKQMYSLEAQKIAKEQGKIQTIITDEGKVALMKPDGKSAGYFLDKDTKQPVIVQKDMPQSAILEANNLANQMEDATKAFARNPIQTDEDKRAHAAKMERLQERYDQILAPYKKRGDAPPPAKKPIVMPSYKDKGVNPKTTPQSTPLPGPLKTPSDVTTAPPGATGALRGLVPGLGMIENYLKK